MTGNLYLSEAIDLNDIKAGQLNIICAPCGGGKTPFGQNELTKYVSDPRKILYLIDTTNGKLQRLTHPNTMRFLHPRISCMVGAWRGKRIESKMQTMTYHHLSMSDIRVGDLENCYDYIICDEMHNLFKYSKFGSDESKQRLQSLIWAFEYLVVSGKVKIIALTATPKSIYKGFNERIENVQLQGDVRSYETKQISEYSNINNILPTLKGCGIIYTKSITGAKNKSGKVSRTSMKAIEQRLLAEGRRVVSIWSINNTEHPMTEEQLAVRKYLLEHEKIPDDIEILIINSSSETSLNIRTPLDFMLIHSQDDDIRVQIRGRLRHDLDLCYYYNHAADEQLHIPRRFINVMLTKQMTKELCGHMGFANINGRSEGWTTLKKRIEQSDLYATHEYRTRTTRYNVITLKGDKSVRSPYIINTYNSVTA